MFRHTLPAHNIYLTHANARSPISVIRSGRRFWSQPDRMMRYKVLYFTLGMDAAPLRRTSVIVADKERLRNASARTIPSATKADMTGFQRKRVQQMVMWHKRMQYQEFYMQHMMTRHVWGLLRMYPSGGGKIAGKNGDVGYFADDNTGVHRFTRALLPAKIPEIYERRKWAPTSSLQKS